jgi:hypothetical protein
MSANQQDEDHTQQAGQQAGQQAERKQDSGMPGGGVGRREEPGRTGVYPMSTPEGANPDAPLEDENAWGQGERGAAGYGDSGDSGMMNAPAETEEGEGDDHNDE